MTVHSLSSAPDNPTTHYASWDNHALNTSGLSFPRLVGSLLADLRGPWKEGHHAPNQPQTLPQTWPHLGGHGAFLLSQNLWLMRCLRVQRLCLLNENEALPVRVID